MESGKPDAQTVNDRQRRELKHADGPVQLRYWDGCQRRNWAIQGVDAPLVHQRSCRPAEEQPIAYPELVDQVDYVFV